MNFLKKKILAFVLCFLLGTVAFLGNGFAADPGVTDKEVVLGAWFPLTGLLAFTGTSERDAIQV